MEKHPKYYASNEGFYNYSKMNIQIDIENKILCKTDLVTTYC